MDSKSTYQSVFLTTGNAILDVTDIAGVAYARKPDRDSLELDLVFERKGAPPTHTGLAGAHRSLVERAWLLATQHLVTNGPDDTVFVIDPSQPNREGKIKKQKLDEYIKTLKS